MGATLPTADDVRAIVREELARALADLHRAAPPSAEWATPEQAAEILGKTPKTVRRWAASGRLRATREGSRWRIDRAALPAVKPASPEDHARAALVALPGRR
jgi:excisionase family DNA binding protein